MFLLIAGESNLLNDLIQTGGMLSVLAFFLLYFMKEQKEVRQKMDALVIKYEADIKELRKLYDDKIETFFKRVDDINMKSINTLNDVKTSNENLTEAVNSLTSKLNQQK